MDNNFRDEMYQYDKLMSQRDPDFDQIMRELGPVMEFEIGEDVEEEPYCMYCGGAVGASGCACDVED